MCKTPLISHLKMQVSLTKRIIYPISLFRIHIDMKGRERLDKKRTLVT